jgi:hypothetical protein
MEQRREAMNKSFAYCKSIAAGGNRHKPPANQMLAPDFAWSLEEYEHPGLRFATEGAVASLEVAPAGIAADVVSNWR